MKKDNLAVLCDFDGTVAKCDVGFHIYTKFGNEGWLEINKRWRRGEISSKECLIGEYSLIDADEKEVRDYILKMEIDEGFPLLVSTCKKNHIPIAIVSDGFDFYINTLLEKYGLSDVKVLCNRMWFNGRKVELDFPFYDKGCGVCGNCKRFHVDNLKRLGRTVVYVGDGLSDKFAACASDIIFAKGELKEYLDKVGFLYNDFSCLSEVNEWLKRLIEEEKMPSIKINSPGDSDMCKQEELSFKERSAQNKDPQAEDIKELTMEKTVKDMNDGRYIVYYRFK